MLGRGFAGFDLCGGLMWLRHTTGFVHLGLGKILLSLSSVLSCLGGVDIVCNWMGCPLRSWRI